MTEEQVKALIESMLKGYAESVTEQVSEAVNEQLAQVNKDIQGLTEQVTQPEPAKDSPDSPLEQRLKNLEKELETEKTASQQRQKEAQDLKVASIINSAIDNKGALMKPLLAELLVSRVGEVSASGDQILTKDGKTLDEYVNSFMSSEEGKHFLPSNKAVGTGTDKPSSATKPTDGKLTDDDIAAAFA